MVRSRVAVLVSLVVVVVTVAGLKIRATGNAAQGVSPAKAIAVTVSEGTSMSVAVSPDGLTLAVDLQGSIWTLPAAGGAAKRITDVFNDARQPAWSPDGKWIAFFGYRDGGYDLWAVAPDGSEQHKLTWGPYDDREPAWSHDGTRIAFSSDRGSPLGSDYNIWVLDVRTGAVTQLTRAPAEDYMPTWSPDDKEIAFASTRDGGTAVWAVNASNGQERKVSTAAGRVDAPSWGPSGRIVYHVTTGGRGGGQETSRYEVEGNVITGSENVFAFRASWAGPDSFYYVSDGRIRRRSVSAGGPQSVPFTATLQVIRADTAYSRRKRDFTTATPRQALGIVRPVISPDGKQVAFAAVGDIYVMPIGGKPVNVTKDAALDTDPAWSPDGKRIAFFNVDGMWRVAQMSVLDVATGTVTKIHDSLPQPGSPTWSPDGARIAIANVAPMSTRFREGTNLVMTMSSSGAGGRDDRWFAPVPMLSIDSRGGCGPAWSPDGTKMAAIIEGVLKVWPVAITGEPLGPPRQVTTESAHAPSWAGDSRRILYQSLDKLRTVDIETGETKTIPLDLKWTPAIPAGRIVVHAGRLLDMKTATPRTNVDVTIDGNKIIAVAPHSDAAHGGVQVVDGSGLTVLPGLTEFHSHMQKDYGEAQGRAWLAFGITTVRSPGNTPYEYVEDREANEAGVRPGPRVFGTGYLTEWGRVYYKMGIAVSSVAQFEMELQRAKALQYDLIKSYVRLPDLQQKRMVEFAHGIGIPVATHEIYPAALVGVDNTEHTAATSRRGYSPKMATLNRAYEDVVQLFGKSGRIFCPMISGGGARRLFELEPALKNDPRFALYPEWIQRQVAQQPTPANPGGGGDPAGGSGRMVVDILRAGGLVVAGTDTPNAINLHGELMSYVIAGMSPYDVLKTATVNPARALGLDAGTIEPGKLADLIVVEGDPLTDIAALHHVKRVVANGRAYEVTELVAGSKPAKPSTADGLPR